jgi:DNA-binding NarL/FixJ family response regulator
MSHKRARSYRREQDHGVTGARCVRPIRILLVEPSELLRSVLAAALRTHPDLVVVGSVRGEVEVLLDPGLGDLDVVVLETAGSAIPAVAERLIDEYPAVGVLVADLNRRRVMVCKLRPHVERIEGASPDALVSAIRRAAEISEVVGHD